MDLFDGWTESAKESVEWQLDKHSYAKWAEWHFKNEKAIKELRRKAAVKNATDINNRNEAIAMKESLYDSAKNLVPTMKNNYKCLKPALKYFKKLLKNSITHKIHKIISECGNKAIPHERIGKGPGGMGIYNFHKDFYLEFYIYVQVEGGKFDGLSEPTDWFCLSFNQHKGWNDGVLFKNELDAFIYLIFDIGNEELSSLLDGCGFKNPNLLIRDFVNWS